MPKVSQIKRPLETVFMFDCLFSPNTEGAAIQYNSVNPANRWRSFASRHNKGGNIIFIDGHVEYFKTACDCWRKPVQLHPTRWNTPGRL